ncbi:M13-type metalloendopeptidase [Fluviispira sanaruensis]|uniref:Peptidase M13 C-terminal domain-containing protein n=1 Tax=Fluviispira sanaruensis TaxID=2493639 RepID=A0A4P2VIJ6_FLUSA|nr:M13-type metalloendopeptidase [Fluviispira sanaruensis]BBH52886.1 hypothetical protein JCM31447_13290 [Fluviispira sanaruensis]
MCLFSFKSCKNKPQEINRESDKINYTIKDSVEPCENFYEYVCSNIRDSFKTSLNNSSYLFASIFREHAQKIKKEIGISVDEQTKINFFKEKCIKIGKGPQRCQELGENFYLQEVYAKNINKFIEKYSERKEKVINIFNNLKITAVKKIKDSSYLKESNKNIAIKKLNELRLIIIEPRIEKVENDLLININDNELEKENKYDFFNSMAFARDEENTVYIGLSVINILAAPAASVLNENRVAFILAHEFGHIILIPLNRSLSNIRESLLQEFNNLPENSIILPNILNISYGQQTFFENLSDLLGMMNVYENSLENKVTEDESIKSSEKASVDKDFFIAYARNFCATKEVENKPLVREKNGQKIPIDLHARPIYRVNLGVKRMADFSKLFQCSAKHKLNFDPYAELKIW